MRVGAGLLVTEREGAPVRVSREVPVGAATLRLALAEGQGLPLWGALPEAQRLPSGEGVGEAHAVGEGVGLGVPRRAAAVAEGAPLALGAALVWEASEEGEAVGARGVAVACSGVPLPPPLAVPGAGEGEGGALPMAEAEGQGELLPVRSLLRVGGPREGVGGCEPLAEPLLEGVAKSAPEPEPGCDRVAPTEALSLGLPVA